MSLIIIEQLKELIDKSPDKKYYRTMYMLAYWALIVSIITAVLSFLALAVSLAVLFFK